MGQRVSHIDLNILSVSTTTRKTRHPKGTQATAPDCLFCKISKPGGWAASESERCLHSRQGSHRGRPRAEGRGPRPVCNPRVGSLPDQSLCQLLSWLRHTWRRRPGSFQRGSVQMLRREAPLFLPAPTPLSRVQEAEALSGMCAAPQSRCRVQTPALPLSAAGSLGKSLRLSKHQYPHL